MLFVIDMQDDFLREVSCLQSKWSFVGSVASVVRKANDRDIPIVFVEYVGYGKTLQALQDAARGQFNVVKKKSDDGSDEILSYLEEEEGIDLDSPASYPNLIFCGINSDACVLLTVGGVLRQGFNCRIVQKATANAWDKISPINDSCLVRIWRDAFRPLDPDTMVRPRPAPGWKQPMNRRLRLVKRF